MTHKPSCIRGSSTIPALSSIPTSFNPRRLTTDMKNNPLRNSFPLFLGLLAALLFLAPKSEAQSTWAGVAATTGTLIGTGSSGYYYSAATLAVGDTVYATAASDGLTANALYYVIGISGTAYELSLTPGGAIASLTNTAGTPTATKGVFTWDAAASTDEQAGATWNTTPNGVGAIATISSQGSSGGNDVAIVNPETIGTLNFSASSNDLNLISSNNGTTTTLAALTFATTTGTPTIDDTSTNHIIRLGANDASAHNGSVVIDGTQGLILEASNAGTAIRIENVNWSGFTNGNGAMGTLTLQSGTAATENANVLGSGTGSINVTVGNASTTGSAGAIFNLASGAQTVDVLSGATNGYIYASTASTVLTVGTGNGTGGTFAGVIGQNPYAAAGVNNTISLIKNGTGVQTISGSIVGSSTTTNTVTVNAGELILSGSNSYGGGTTISGGLLQLGNAYALGSGTLTLIAAGAALDFDGNSPTNPVADKAILSGTLLNTGAAVNLTGMGTLGATAARSFFLDGTGNMTFGQQFTGSYSIIKNGSNTVTLSGATGNNLIVTAVNNGTLVLAKTGGVNAVNGATLGISGGTLQLAGLGEINTTTAIVLTSGAYDLNGENQTDLSVSLAGTGISGGGALINSAASTSSTLTAVVTLSAASSLGGSGNLSLAGGIGDGGLGYGITKVGTGALMLNSTNTYTGATDVTAGTLIVSGSISASSGLFVTNATLAGTGEIVSPVTIGNGSGAADSAAIEVGLSGTTGTLSTGALSLNSDAVYKFNLNPTLGTSDLLNVDGTVSLGSGVAAVSSNVLSDEILSGGQIFEIADSTSPISGYFANLPDGTTIVLGDNSYVINYGNGDGVADEITLTAEAIPEPGAWAMMLGGTGMLMAFGHGRRRRL